MVCSEKIPELPGNSGIHIRFERGFIVISTSARGWCLSSSPDPRYTSVR